MKKKRIISIFLIFLCVVGFSQSKELSFKNLGVKDGLSQSWITTICQDSLGFIWFGTNDGLNRYDGYGFEVFNHISGDSTSIVNNQVQCSYVDHNGAIWVGTISGFSKFIGQSNNFVNNKNWPRISINVIDGDKEFLYLGSVDGLFIYNLKTEDIDEENSNKVNQLFTNSRINALCVDKQRNLWIGTGRGLFVLDFQTHRLEHVNETNVFPVTVGIDNQNIRSLAIDSENRIWAGTIESGLFLIEAKNNNFYVRNFAYADNRKNSIGEGSILALSEDGHGNIWVGVENSGLYILETKEIYKSNSNFNKYQNDPSDNRSISSNSVQSIFLDARKDMWVGTYGAGVNYINAEGARFRHFTKIPKEKNSLINKVVNKLYLEGNKLWVGTEGGISVLNLQTQNYEHFVHEPSDKESLRTNAIWEIYRDSKNTLWAGTWAGGLNKLNPLSKKFTTFISDINDSNSINSDNVFSVLEDSKGTLWVGTMGGGPNIYNSENNSFKPFEFNLDHSNSSVYWIRQIFESEDGSLWFSTPTHILLFDRTTKRTREFSQNQSPGSFQGNGAHTIFEDSKGTIWFGTDAGLNYFDSTDSTFFCYKEKHGLPNNSIKSIQEDANGNFWMGTNNGLVKFRDAISKPTNPKFKIYDISDGLQGNEFNRRASTIGPDGMLYFGGINGVNIFHPDSIKDNTTIPQVVLTNLKILNREVGVNSEKSPLKEHISVSEKLVFTHDHSVLTFEFAALSYFASNKNQYAYMLEGFEDKWNYVGTQRSATYTNLDAGDYLFKVKAANNDGIWNERPRIISIKVLPPWWKSKLAFVMYILVFLSALYSFLKISQLRYQERHVIKLERLKHDQEEQLVQQKLQFFTNISHEFRTPLMLISSPLEDILKNSQHHLPRFMKEKFRIVYKNAERLNRLIEELMDFRKLQYKKLRMKVQRVEVTQFLANILDYFAEEARSNKITLSLSADSNLDLYMDRRMMEKVLFNLISNAMKVTEAGGNIDLTVLTNSSPGVLQEQEIRNWMDRTSNFRYRTGIK